jgi:hypothetical protein
VKEMFLQCAFGIVSKLLFSNSSLVLDRRPIGRKFWGNFGSLPGFSSFLLRL